MTANAAKTHCVNGHELNEANAYVNFHGHRTCRVCRRQRQRDIRERERTGRVGVRQCRGCGGTFHHMGNVLYCSEECRPRKVVRGRCRRCQRWTRDTEICQRCSRGLGVQLPHGGCHHAGCDRLAVVSLLMDPPAKYAEWQESRVRYCDTHLRVVARLFHVKDVQAYGALEREAA